MAGKKIHENRKELYKDEKGMLYILCNGTWILLTVFVIMVCLPFTLPRIFGSRPYTIVSGSMEPELPIGSIVYVREVQPEELRSGEIITFYSGMGDDGAVTHRVVENRIEERELITKGDANKVTDPVAVTYERVIGRVKFHIPRLGWLFPLISGTAGKMRLLAVLLAAMLIRTVGGRIEQQKRSS